MKWRLLRSPIEREDDVVAVRQRARLLAEHLRLSRQDQTGLATAVSEIARNAYGYAGGGIVDYGLDEDGLSQILLVRISDSGSGIADLEAVLDGRFVSSTGMGLGIVGARRLTDVFEVASGPGSGTVVTLGKRLPKGREPLSGRDVAALSDMLRRERDADPQQAVRAQNRDLMQSLADLAEKQAETSRLNAELREARDMLEARVSERTAELARANDRLREEAVARERIEGELRQAHKMKAVGQLTSGIAHDFNNLLTGITGSLDLLQVRFRQGRLDKVDRYIETAVGSAQRAATLTHRLLVFSRPHPIAPSVTDADAVIQDMHDLLVRTLPANVVFRATATPGLWSTLCDAHQLENAVLNLCINARDAMPDGGTLTVDTSNVRFEPNRPAQGLAAVMGDHVRIAVEDTGTGMTPEVLARVFEPFFTTKPVGKGTGLGMAMIYGFARQSKGFCQIESEPGRGTRVLIYLPRHEPGPPADRDAPERPVEPAPMSVGTADILLVEGDAAVRDLVAEVLRDLGHRVVLAADGEDALRRLEAGAPVHLIVTDMSLSRGVGGLHLTEQARSARPDLKILFITGYVDEAEAAAGAVIPGVAVLSKPFHVEALVDRVTGLLAGGFEP